MTATYLTTDIIVIIVLVVVLVFVGLGAFFIHYYWTKIGISEIWNTAKWSSMRSSFYRTFRRFSGRSDSKYGSEPVYRNDSIYSNSVDDVVIEKPKANPKITSYITPTNNLVQKPVSIIPSNQPPRNNYGTRLGQPIENTQKNTLYEENKYTNRSRDLASSIQKQRF